MSRLYILINASLSKSQRIAQASHAAAEFVFQHAADQQHQNNDGQRGVRHLTLRTIQKRIEVKVFETADLGSPDFLDLGEFGPVNPDVEFGDADLTIAFDDLAACYSYLEHSWPGCTQAFVIEGMVQDEYADYLARDS